MQPFTLQKSCVCLWRLSGIRGKAEPQMLVGCSWPAMSHLASKHLRTGVCALHPCQAQGSQLTRRSWSLQGCGLSLSAVGTSTGHSASSYKASILDPTVPQWPSHIKMRSFLFLRFCICCCGLKLLPYRMLYYWILMKSDAVWNPVCAGST